MNAFTTENEITIDWDLPECADAEAVYEVTLDGVRIGETKHTHYTVSGLAPEQTYEVGAALATGAWQQKLQVSTTAQRRRIDVTADPYLAVGDGVTMNTEALQRAIDDCGSGEQVYLPAGVYLTGALRLHSDMELYIDEGAVLQGTAEVDDYLPRIWSRFEGIEQECYSSVLNLGELDHNAGYNCENVVIRGGGTIASGGQKLALAMIASETERLKDELAAMGDRIRECESEHTIPGRVRPRLINMSNCRNVTIAGLTLKDGASWNVHMIYSDQIRTFGCTFISEGVWNGDGWDPDSSTNCTIFGCRFFTGDDSVAIKSGKNPQGNEIGRPTAHIRVFDCACAFGHGICIGSEMSGGVEDVRIWDCDLIHSMSGIEIKATKKRGGYVRGISVKNCATSRLMFHSVGYNDDGIGAKVPPVFEHCTFENVHITGSYLDHEHTWHDCDALELIGFDEPGHALSDVRIKNVMLGKKDVPRRQTISLQACEGINIENLRVL